MTTVGEQVSLHSFLFGFSCLGTPQHNSEAEGSEGEEG